MRGRSARLGGALGLVGLLLVVGCRQPNPEYLGPASASGMDTSGGDSSSGDVPSTSTSGGGGESTSTGSATTTTGSGGGSCNSDDQCAQPTPICGPMGCQAGQEGDPCTGAGDCSSALAPLCGPDDLCHDGMEGDPCASNGDCESGFTCDADVCTAA